MAGRHEDPRAEGPHQRWSGFQWYFKNPDNGPLPALLLLMTAATGMIDAVSILGLGRVFVANMTGNVVFSAFALVGAPGFSLAASLVALGGFLVGASAGGRLVRRAGVRRGALVRSVLVLEVLSVGFALVVATAAGGRHLGGGTGDVVAAFCAMAMGMQNALARRLAVPDLTTTVLTMTLTGIAADIRSGNSATAARRLLAVAAMALGAVVGGALLLHTSVAWGLGAATGVLGVVALTATIASRHDADWAGRT